ncbi:AAA family ATPase [Fusobacterium animalis]|uniref:AAA family ATPase n=1 Tax=Fusobacterium animalis TaxID=76859 RepID=UPI0032443C0C
MKRIGIGLSDFKHLIEEDFYYFDKTKFIDEIIKDGAQVKLFTRPRRFGKTLNMSMLKYFFDIKEADENRKLFKNLYIEKTESFKEQGQYPVVFLSLKDLKATTWEEMEMGIKSTISRLFLDHRYLLNDLDKFDTITFENIIMKNTNIEDLKEALKFLTESLYKKYSQKVAVLIDEYDSPLVSAYINGYYNKAKDFFKTFYSTVLKDNSYLQMGILTGIIRVIKAGIFSDLNNLRTYTILSDVFYTDSYGLTEEEVEKSLKDYGLEYEISKVKDWYDGYKFGNSEVYNPWSILNFLQDKELRAYWVDTSGNDLINDVLKKITKDTVRALERLFNGEGLRQNISGTSDLSKLLDENELWELLLFSGYLTIEEKIDQKNYILRLPNKEVKELFKDSFLEKYFGRGNKLSDLMEALIKNRIDEYEEKLQEILLTSVSYNDTKKGNEAFYHGLIMGMGLYLEGDYITKSNIESGLGRYDFSVEPKNKNKRAFIMEFKSTDSVEKLEEVSKEALEQIENKKYDISLKQNGIKEITHIGIAFCGKQIKISCKQ